MGIYSLTAQILDRAEAAESLRANTVWCRGLTNCTVSLSDEGADAFLRGATPKPETLCAGKRGNFYAFASIELRPKQSCSWYIAADVGRSHQDVAQIRKRLLAETPIGEALEESIADDHKDLFQNVASADGLQATGSQLASAHHFANVLFNNMR